MANVQRTLFEGWCNAIVGIPSLCSQVLVCIAPRTRAVVTEQIARSRSTRWFDLLRLHAPPHSDKAP